MSLPGNSSRDQYNSDDGDDDYAPPPEGDDSGGSDSDAPSAKRAKQDTPNDAPLEVPLVQDGAGLWASFKASALQEQPKKAEEIKTVKIVKTMRFAGELITQILEVDADSAEARTWPRYSPTVETTEGGEYRTQPSNGEVQKSVEEPPSMACPDRKTSLGPIRRGKKKTLGEIPSTKAKKISTLDKSLMDWKTHVSAQENEGMKDDLEANRRGGGYLDKVDFMDRVSQRREEERQALGSKRRRGQQW